MTAAQTQRICLGRIAGAHGIKGLVKLQSFCDDPRLLESLGPLYTAAQGEDTISLTLKNPQGQHWLAEIKDVRDRTAAEALRGTELYADKSRLPAIEDEDSFYYADLKGLQVRDAQGETVGIVISVDNFGAGDLIEIRLRQSGKSFYLPFRADTVGDVKPDEGWLQVRDYEDFILD